MEKNSDKSIATIAVIIIHGLYLIVTFNPLTAGFVHYITVMREGGMEVEQKKKSV